MQTALLFMMVISTAIVGCAPVERSDTMPDMTVVAAGEQPLGRCPQCGGALVKVGTIDDDRAKPSKNISVWNRSICANQFYDDDSMICSKCWLSYSKTFERWERSSELPESFGLPLAKAIRDCPLPPREEIKSTVVYSQEISGEGVQEEVRFWCVDSDEYLAKVKKFAREHQLTCRVEQEGRIEKQVYIVVETAPTKLPNR